MSDFRLQPNMHMPQSAGAMGLSRDTARQVWPPVPMAVPDGVMAFTRYYSVGLDSSEVDFSVGVGAIRICRFDLPVTVIAINAAVNKTDGTALPVNWNPRDCFSVNLVANRESITIDTRLGSTVCGTAEKPGFLAGSGWQMSSGSTLQCTIVPRVDDTRIDLVFCCLEYRTGSSFQQGR